MKFKSSLFSSFTIRTFFLFFTVINYGQNSLPQSPNVASAISFEEFPVDLSTGTANVNVPLFEMPTLSEDVSFKLGLTYHPIAVSDFYKNLGNSGRGWYLNTGGVIGRIIVGYPDEITSGTTIESNDIYTFNFMGIQGKFKISRAQGSNVLSAVVTENPSNENIVIDIVQNGLNVEQFKFYDTKGTQYVFQNYDTFTVRHSGTNKSFRNSFHISSVKDCNNNILLNFSYANENVVTMAGIQGNISYLTEIKSLGIGTFTYIPYTIDFDQFRYGSVLVKDSLDNFVSTFNFSYADVQGVEQLSEVILINSDDSVRGKYKFFYNTTLFANAAVGHDAWGYKNLVSEICPNNSDIALLADTYNCIDGVLEKMTTPTGGSILFEYESNTYSFQNGFRLDLDSQGQIDNNFYIDIANPRNRENYIRPLSFSKSFSSSDSNPLYINITEPGTTLYFQFKGNPFSSGSVANQGGQSTMVSPVFTLSGSNTNVTFNPSNSYGSDSNNCMGKSYTFNYVGTYTLTMSNVSQTTGFASAYAISLKSDFKKWWYGGGIRIKTIGYFTDKDVPQNYYRSSNNSNTYVPVRQLNYSYTLDSDTSISSGSLNGDGLWGNSIISYRNVTVYDSSGNGKLVNTYYTPIDYPEDYSTTDFRTGKLLKQVVYNSANQAISQTDLKYQIIGSINQQNTQGTLSYNMGWVVPTEVRNVEYFNTDSHLSLQTFVYDNSRRLIEQQESTSRANETSKTKYYYHSGNSIYSKNRITEIDHVEKYLNDELISTSKIIYDNNWYDGSNSVLLNVSYLPKEIQSSKSSNSLQGELKVNLYDKYGHELETEEVNGNKVARIWGYNNSKVIAEIIGVSYSSISQVLITEAQDASNGADEALLLVKLNNLRNSIPSGAFIKTFTYKPLIGISTETDFRGFKKSYEYKPDNTLWRTKDSSGNIILETENHLNQTN